MDEGWGSDPSHEIPTQRFLWSSEAHRSWTSALKSKFTLALIGSLNLGVRLMNWTRCGVSKFIGGMKVMDKSSSRGASIRATRTSKYSLAPLNSMLARLGRIERVIGGRRFSLSGRDREDRNSRESSSSLDNAERQVAIVSGEM